MLIPIYNHHIIDYKITIIGASLQARVAWPTNGIESITISWVEQPAANQGIRVSRNFPCGPWIDGV